MIGPADAGTVAAGLTGHALLGWVPKRNLAEMPGEALPDNLRAIWYAVGAELHENGTADPVQVLRRCREHGISASRVSALMGGGCQYVIGSDPDAQLEQLLDYGRRARTAALAEGLPQAIREGTGLELARALLGSLEAPANPQLEVLDLAGLLTGPPEPIPRLFDDYLFRGAVTLLAGDAGSGKSLLAADAAIGLANGLPFLGRFQPHVGPSRVLIVDEENPGRLIAHRWRRLLEGRGLDAGDLENICYVSNRGLDLSRDRDLGALLGLIEQFEPKLVILDSLVRFLGGIDANDSSQVASFFGRLARIHRDFGVALLVLHHVRKRSSTEAETDRQARVRGSSDLTAGVSEVLVFEKNPGGEGRTLYQTKNRFEPERPALGIEFEGRAGDPFLRLVATGAPTDMETVLVSALAEAETDGVLRAGLVARLEDNGSRDAQKMANRLLGRLYDRGRICKRQEGKAVRYWSRDFAPADILRAESALRSTP